MEALNAGGLTPISVLSDRRSEPIKFFPNRTTSPLKPTNSTNFITNLPNPRNFHKGLVPFSSVLNAGFAIALTYEEALQSNPVVVAGGVAITLVPPIVYQVFVKKPKPWGVESARNAYAKLGDDGNAQLLDVREPAELRQVGSPHVRDLKKKRVSIVYQGKDKAGFLKKLSLKFKEPQNITLFILDKFDGNSELVAELVTSIGFKAAYAIKDGAEGPRGWLNSGLPWILPKKTLSLDFSDLTDAIGGAIGVETLLQLLGSAALLQVIGKKLLLAEARKQTLQQVDGFLTTKVAPKELVDEIKQIWKALLPATVTSKTLLEPTEATPTIPDDAVQKAEAAAEPPQVSPQSRS